MSGRQTTFSTVEDYRALPEHGPRYQLIQGELSMAPAPNRYHQEISANIEFVIRKHLESHPIGKLYDAPFDVFLSESNVFQPDLLFIANDRLSILTEEGAAGAPTLVVEILSARTASVDRSSKKTVYWQTGVEELWLIDPDRKRVEVYRLQHDPERPAAIWDEADRFSSVCFPGLEIQGREIFKA